MALMHLTIIPLGTGSPSVGEFIADIQNALRTCGFPHEMHDMGTIVEGRTEELLKLASQLAELPFQGGVNRVVTQISIDDRRDRRVALGDKRSSVIERAEGMHKLARK
jgi:uncharacterized protein (TIGR00106 family)